jgi:hypothetical protein
MRSGKTDWLWPTGSSTPNGRKTKEKFKEPGKNNPYFGILLI